MNPICFYIFSRPIYSFGIMAAIGFLTALLYWTIIARKEGRPEGFASDIAFWTILSGIIGARLAYVIANFSDYAADPLSIIRIDRGGLIYYGGFVGGIVAMIIYARVRKESLWALGDFVVSGLPLGHAFGRIGCFLNGCCYGLPCDCAYGVYMHGASRMPVQLFEASFNLLLFVFLAWFYQQKKRAEGTVVALYMIIYPVGRWSFEFLRGDERQMFMGQTIAQNLSLLVFIAGVILLAYLVLRSRGNKQK